MKQFVNTFTVLLLLFSGCMTTSAQDNIKMKYVPGPKDLEELSEKLVELESNEISTINDIKDYVKQVENFAVEYYLGPGKKRDIESIDKKDVTVKALRDVKNYADKMANGSTREMMECGILNTVIYHYNTGLNSERLSGQIDLPVVDAVTDEIQAWQKLENTLSDYYGYSAFMESQGGSMAYLAATGSAWNLAEARYNDTNMLLRAGFGRGFRSFQMIDNIKKNANETAKDLTSKATDLLDCEDDFKASPYYKEVSKGLTEACENLKTDMDAWINARVRLVACLEDQLIGISETQKLLTQIKKIGTPEQ